MTATIHVLDESLAGERSNRRALVLPGEDVSVRELIRERVYQEVQDFNLARSGVFRGLVQPAGAEPSGAGHVVSGGREVDWRQQFALACDAFERKRLLVLIGDRQALELDERFTVAPGTEVSFVRLVPLVGG
jgi:hypothetical protein